MEEWRLIFLFFLLPLGVLGRYSSFELGQPDTPTDSEQELPSHRRTTRISRIPLLTQSRPLERSQITKRENQFDVVGATNDDVKIMDFWRNYGKLIEANSNVDKGLLEELDPSLVKIENLSEVKEKKKLDTPTIDDSSFVAVKGTEEELVELEKEEEAIHEIEKDLPSHSSVGVQTDDLSAKFSARSEAVEGPEESQIPEGIPPRLPYPYNPPAIQELGNDPVRMQPPPPPRPPQNFLYYDNHAAYPFPVIHGPPQMPVSEGIMNYPNRPIGFYRPMPVLQNGGHPIPALTVTKHSPYMIPSPANEMQSIPPPGQPGSDNHPGYPPPGHNREMDFASPIGRQYSFAGVPQPSYPSLSQSGASFQGPLVPPGNSAPYQFQQSYPYQGTVSHN